MVIKIIDVQEPPVVDMDVNFFEENPEINELYDKSDDGQNFTFFHKEGQMVIARFNADDTYDQSPKAYQFEGKINPSPDSKFFELRVNDEGGRDLAWNLNENEFLYGLPDYEKMQEDPSFEIRLSVKEKLSQGGDVVDGMTREVKVTVEVVPVPNKAPVFVPTDPSKYDPEFEEEQENLLVDSFEALDPDEAEGVLFLMKCSKSWTTQSLSFNQDQMGAI